MVTNGINAGDDWSDHGLGFTEISNFVTSVDSLAFMDNAESPQNLFTNLAFGLPASATAGDGAMYIDSGVSATLDDVNSVRNAIATSFNQVAAGTSFGIGVFEYNSRTRRYDAGFFRAEWSGSGDSGQFSNSTDLVVLPMAKITNLSSTAATNINLFSAPSIVSTFQPSEVNSALG